MNSTPLAMPAVVPGVRSAASAVPVRQQQSSAPASNAARARALLNVAGCELRALARRVVARHRRRRAARVIREELADLDDHTLRDLGFHRAEIGSVAAEMTLAADCTRIRVLHTLYGGRG